MTRLYTIGFTSKSAERFFSLLQANEVKKLVDVRRKGDGQLAGFAKASNLDYLCRELLGIPYLHLLELAPCTELMQQWRARTIPYSEYRSRYVAELDQRRVLTKYTAADFDGCCFLCSEADPTDCHRLILAEYFKEHCSEEIKIIHL